MSRIRPRFFICLSVFAVCAHFAVPALQAQAQNSSAAAPIVRETGPVVVPRERQFDLTSRINGLVYRLMISAPVNAVPGRVYPVLYVLDGNWYFRAASDTATWGSGPFEPAIVVGIGYPTEDYAEVRRRRSIDMTVKADPVMYPNGSGRCDEFLRAIEDEVKPFVASRYPVDPARQMLYGKSLGGLAVLRALLRNPTSYRTYIAASPSIWQGDKAVLADEPAFADRARAGALNLRILTTSASKEEYLGSDPAKLAAEKDQMITNALALADRLGKLNPETIAVRYAMIQDEGHSSVSLATIARALTFALPAPPAKK